jgi:Holliday junction resolvasome RuvABC endonuclease subunit
MRAIIDKSGKIVSGPIVTGWDLGLAHCGWSDVMLLRDRDEVQDLGVFITEKSNKKQNVLSSDDDFRRGRELARMMTSHILTVKPVALVVEAKSLPRNSSAACKIGMAWGAFCAVAQQSGLPVVQASPQQVRKALGLARNASKQDVKEVIWNHLDLLPERVRAKMSAQIPDSKREHPIDATAAVLACRESEILRLARGTASRK